MSRGGASSRGSEPPAKAASATGWSVRPPPAAGEAPAPLEETADWPVRGWPELPGAQQESTDAALDQADEAAEALSGCDGVEVRAVDCSAPPCMVFFSAPGATCLALSNWEHHAPGCPNPLGHDGVVLSAPIVCPDGYRECVRALVPANVKEIAGFEDAEGSDSDRELEILFSVGHRLTRSAPAWACSE